jgi:hypothetical protein
MDYWQVRAVLENGAVLLFGVQADSITEAAEAADERLADTGQLVTDVSVCPLAAACER